MPRKKVPIILHNTQELIKALEKELDIKFFKWDFMQGNTHIDFFIKSHTEYEDLIVDSRKEANVIGTLLDGKGNPIKDDYKNEVFQQFSGNAIKGKDFDELFEFVVESVNKNRDLRRKEAKIDPDGQMWLF